jgi:hypothetical protein
MKFFFEIIVLDMLNIFSIKKTDGSGGASSDTGSKKTSAALLRATKGYL